MPFCGNCGNQIAEEKKFCGSCGQPVETASKITDATTKTPANQPQLQSVSNSTPGNSTASLESLKSLAVNTADYSGTMCADDVAKNKTMGGLAYFLFFLPLIACPESKYGRFHANQGLLLLLLCVAGGIVTNIVSVVLLGISWQLYLFVSILSLIIWLAVAAVGVIGLINGFSGKAKELPIIGKIRIIK